MTDCNGCGCCCDPVVLPYSQVMVQKAMPFQFADPEMRRFVLDDLTPIPYKEGWAKATYLHGRQGIVVATDPRDQRGSADGEILLVTNFFYRCRWFDDESRTCTNYDNRPSMCSDYPWYGEPPDPMKVLPDECSYNAVIGKPVQIRTGAR